MNAYVIGIVVFYQVSNAVVYLFPLITDLAYFSVAFQYRFFRTTYHILFKTECRRLVRPSLSQNSTVDIEIYKWNQKFQEREAKTEATVTIFRRNRTRIVISHTYLWLFGRRSDSFPISLFSESANRRLLGRQVNRVCSHTESADFSMETYASIKKKTFSQNHPGGQVRVYNGIGRPARVYIFLDKTCRNERDWPSIIFDC